MKALNRKFSFFSVFSVLCLLMLLCACGRKSSEMIEKSNTPARVAALSRSIAELWLLPLFLNLPRYLRLQNLSMFKKL